MPELGRTGSVGAVPSSDPRLHAYHPLGTADGFGALFSQPLLFFLQQPINLLHKRHELFGVLLHSCLLAKLSQRSLSFMAGFYHIGYLKSVTVACKKSTR